MKARLTAYAGYQLRDFAVGRALVLVLATAAAIGVYAVGNGLTPALLDSAGGLEAREQLERAFEFAIAVFAIVAASIAAQGLVSRDRRRGFDRVIFSRRLSPARFYLQGFVLAGVASILIACVAAQLYAAMVHPVSIGGVAALVGLACLTIGGLAFVLSTVTPFHVPLLAIVIAADLALDQYVNALGASGIGRTVGRAVQYVLPPAHVIVGLRSPLARGLSFDPRQLIWPSAFGLACLVAAFILLRRRPLGS